MHEYKSETARALDSLAAQVANLGFARYVNPADGPGAIEGLTMHLDTNAKNLVESLDYHSSKVDLVADALVECANGLNAIAAAIREAGEKR